MALDLFTCSYPHFRHEMGVPVRFTVGAPRFVKYPIVHHFRSGTPRRDMLHLPRAQYEAEYRALLERAGIGRIGRELLDIAEITRDSRLVLLCFENLSKPDLWCHRTMFAQWWQETVGDPVRELGPRPEEPPAATHVQEPLL